jgi:hypothetical protein
MVVSRWPLEFTSVDENGFACTYFPHEKFPECEIRIKNFPIPLLKFNYDDVAMVDHLSSIFQPNGWNFFSKHENT